MHRVGRRACARFNTSRLLTLSGAVLAIGLACSAGAQSAPPVLQRGYDRLLSGANVNESALNVANVTVDTFGMLYTAPVDDAIFAQPLYVPGVAISNQGTHNVVYVATMSDTLYALDAETGAQLWSINLASLVGATPVAIAPWVFSGNKNVVGNLGILSTPVIDLSTNWLYAVSCTLENDTLEYRVWAVDIRDGSLPLGVGVPISASYGGSTFDARYQTQRASLTIAANEVVFGFGPIELEYAGGYVGWVMQYNKHTLAQNGVFATVTTGNRGAGVWQSGRAPAIDSTRHAYVFTGNAYGDGYDGVGNFSESALKLDTANHLALVDWFTPHNWSSLDTHDLDLSSSGPALLPTADGLLVGGGKQGILYVLHSSGLGKETGTDSGALQQISVTNEFRGGPVYWQRTAAHGGLLLYTWNASDVLKSYTFNGTEFATSPGSQSTINEGWPGGILALSAWGARPNTGIVWANVSTGGDAENNPPTPGALFAFNAEDVSQELWDSTMDASRDGLGNFGKFVPPLVANGRVYVATWSKRLAVYGLLSSFTARPGALAFGSEPVGTKSAPLSVTLTNTGSITLLIKHIFLSSVGPDPFSQTNNCGSSVAAAGQCTINVYFTPQATGAAAATLNVTTTSGAPTQQIGLSGTGS